MAEPSGYTYESVEKPTFYATVYDAEEQQVGYVENNPADQIVKQFDKASISPVTPSEFTFGAPKSQQKPVILPESQPTAAAGYSYESQPATGYATNDSSTGYSYATPNPSENSSSGPNSTSPGPPAEFSFGAKKPSMSPNQATPPIGYSSDAHSYATNTGESATGYSYQQAPAAASSAPPAKAAENGGYSYSDTSSGKPPVVSENLKTPTDTSATPQRDWTQEMYSHLSTVQKRSLRESGNNIVNEDKFASRGTTVNSLIDVATSFTAMATDLGTTIIEEKFKPAEKRTIKSQNVGGVAGGEKYIHEGIFFKFAVDDHGLYGDIERAMKTAGHEMKGLTALIDWELKTVGLHTVKFPLMILVDFRGSRLAATSSLPIGSKTLVVGSGDSGKSINGPTSGPGAGRPSTELLFQLFKEWGRFLNLREHEMYTAKRTKEVVPIAFDVEGHVGKDGNLWCVDFARVFPPSAFVPKLRGGFLFQLLRPEFVKSYPRPLCADAYLKALTDRTMDADINEATRYLKTEHAVSIAKIFDQMPVLPTRIMALIVHQYGINYRYLRFIAVCVKRPEIRQQLNAEILARVLKNVMRREFRSLKSSEQPPYLRAIARTLNSVFNVNEISNAYWNGDLLAEIDYRFETPSDDVFASLERSLRHDSAAILAPLGPEALGSAPASKSRRKKESRTGSVSSSYSSASSGYSNPDEDYATQSAPAPAPVAVKKSTSGRLIKQPQPFSGISVERDDEDYRDVSGYATALSTAPASRSGRSKGRRRPSDAPPTAYGYNAEPAHSYAESSEAVLAEVQIKKDVSALKEKTTIKREDVNLQELFSRLVSMMCIDVHPSAQSKLSQMLAGNTELRFDESDIANYRPTVKTMFLTSFQQAYSKKEAADKTDDFVERERLLQQASEVYLDCLERHTRNSFALHNFARVLLALAPFRSFNQEEEKQLVFIAKKMASVAEAENKHLKRAEIDLYQYNELYDEAGRPRKINPAKVWLRPETIQRLVLLRQEMEDSLNALNEAQDAADSEMVIELLSMLKESYISIFDELLDEADEQGSLINSVPRRAALYCWKLYVSVFPQNALAWERIVAELYSEGRIYITRDQWNALADELYGM